MCNVDIRRAVRQCRVNSGTTMSPGFVEPMAVESYGVDSIHAEFSRCCFTTEKVFGMEVVMLTSA